MIIIPIKEEFDKLFLNVSSIINLLENRRYTFIDETRRFIGALEKKAEQYKLPFTQDLAILRGKLNIIDELSDFSRQSGYSPDSRRIQRRNREAFVLKRLDEACQLIRTFFAAQDNLLTEAHNLCRQVTALAHTKKLFPANQQNLNQEMLRILWEAVKKDSDMCSLCTHIEGLVGIHNTIILFDRAMSELEISERTKIKEVTKV